MTTARHLADLISVGPAMLRDFDMLGIHSVAQLARQEPRRMYERLNQKTGQRQDPCVLDTFCAAVAQARNPRLPAEQCQWWYWSKKRKQLSGDANSQIEIRDAKRTEVRGKWANRIGATVARAVS
jgi:pathogenicity locus Cdd1 protein